MKKVGICTETSVTFATSMQMKLKYVNENNLEENSDHVAQYNDGIRATRCRYKVQLPVRVKFLFSP